MTKNEKIVGELKSLKNSLESKRNNFRESRDQSRGPLKLMKIGEIKAINEAIAEIDKYIENLEDQ